MLSNRVTTSFLCLVLTSLVTGPLRAQAPQTRDADQIASDCISELAAIVDEFENAWNDGFFSSANGTKFDQYEQEISAYVAAGLFVRARATYNRARGELIRDGRRTNLDITGMYSRCSSQVRSLVRPDLVEQIRDEYDTQRDRGGQLQAAALDVFEGLILDGDSTVPERLRDRFAATSDRLARDFENRHGRYTSRTIRQMERFAASGRVEVANRIADRAVEVLNESEAVCSQRIARTRDSTIRSIRRHPDSENIVDDVTTIADNETGRATDAGDDFRDDIDNARP